jgi:hypothetical protein
VELFVFAESRRFGLPFAPPNLFILLGESGFESHSRKNNVRDKDEKVWLYLWLYVAKYHDRFKHFEEFSVRARLV